MATVTAESLARATEYFGGDDLAANVYLTKYALPGEDTPDIMHRRLAKEFARIEAKYPNPLTEDEIFGYFDKFKYIVPQGSPMAGIGNPNHIMSISNCFVIESPYDSYAGILKTDQEQAQLMKRRGGVGFDISSLRPRGLDTANAAKTTDGTPVFMERYSNTTREVAQNGRRGALMLTMDVRHPDIKMFATIKGDLTKVTGANISIKLTDEFMKAVQNNEIHHLQWPIDSDNPVHVDSIPARELWDLIVTQAHASAEPGLLFWDTVKRRSPADAYPEYHSQSVNPCGEVTLSVYDSCRLLLINLSSFVENPFSNNPTFNTKLYREVVRVAQRLMDDMIDLELECVDRILDKIDNDPEPEDVKYIEKNLWIKIRNACERGRRTGLGLTAVGDAVAALNIKYGSDEGVSQVEQMYMYLALAAYQSSVEMAKERGAFPAFDYDLEKNHEFINQIMNLDPQLKEDWQRYGRRNIAITTTAPAGSVSILTQTTSGIENAFLLEYSRNKKINPEDRSAIPDFVDAMGDAWQTFPVYHHYFKKWMEVTGKTDPAESPYAGSTSADIDWLMKVKVQAAAQKWICHAISNTTNVPADTSVETIKEIYMAGWELGCKGVTVYRDGSRSGVLVSNDKKKDEKGFIRHDAPKRPKELPCDIYNMTVMGEKWTFFVGLLEDKPYEIMGGLTKYVNIPRRVKKGKIVKLNGSSHPIAQYELHYDYERGPDDEGIVGDITNVFDNATHAAFTRTLSLALRHGADVQFVVEQLQKGAEKEDDLFSFSKGASRVLKHYIEDGTKSDKKCLECGDFNLAYQDGCMICLSCGSSKCG